MSLAEEVHEDMQRRAHAVNGTDHSVLAGRLERDVKQFCTLQAMHHAVECALDSLNRVGDEVLAAERDVFNLVRAS